jgi:hypothetical protein
MSRMSNHRNGRHNAFFAGVVGAIGALALACGGEIVGVGNSGNRIQLGGTIEEVAEALAESSSTPEVTDAVISEIYAAILARANRGDPEAAMIILQVAEQQRREAEED